MAEQTQQKKEKDPLDTREVALDAFNKKVKEHVSGVVDQAINAPEPTDFKALLGNLLEAYPESEGSQSTAQSDILKQVMDLAGTPIPTGKKEGFLTSFTKTGSFKRIPETEPLGIDDAAKVIGIQADRQADINAAKVDEFNTALDVLKIQMQQEEKASGKPSKDLQFIKLMQSVMGGTPEGQRQAEISKAEGQAIAQQKKSAQKTAENFRIAQDKLKLTMKKFDEAMAETQRITGGKIQGGGRLGGTVTAFLGMVGANPKVKAFQGDLVETSTAIAKIAAPSAKVGPDLIKLFSKTLPNIGFFVTSTDQEAREQIVTSITNGFINYMATHPEEAEGANIDMFEAQMRQVVNSFADRGESIFKDASGQPGAGQTLPQEASLTPLGEKTQAAIELENLNTEIQVEMQRLQGAQ